MPSSNFKTEQENICSDCLYFTPPPNSRRLLSGNCCLYKEWINNASRTTCSEMSNQKSLKDGIYELLAESSGKWLYIRRRERVRTRLFLVRKPAERGRAG